MKLNDLSPQALKAALQSGAGDWGKWGSYNEHSRYYQEAPKSRRRCHCGCKKRTTHLGMCNGVCLTSGCEFSVRQWVKYGYIFKPKPPKQGE